jgi:hypothetical protein
MAHVHDYVPSAQPAQPCTPCSTLVREQRLPRAEAKAAYAKIKEEAAGVPVLFCQACTVRKATCPHGHDHFWTW